MFETTLLESTAEQTPVLTSRHRIAAMLAGTTVFVAAWKALPMLLFTLKPEAALAASLFVGAFAALHILMAGYVLSESRRLGLSRAAWLAATIAASVFGFMAFLVRAARRTGDWRRAALPLATTLEITALGALLLIPLIHTQAIDLKNLRALEPPSPPPPASVKIIDVIREKASRPAPDQYRAGVIVEPTAIPQHVAQIEDEPPPQIGPGDGVIGAVPLGPGGPGSGDSRWLEGLTRHDPPPPSPQHAPRPQARQVIGGEVQAAKLIYALKPTYPELAKSIHVQGTVRLEALIGADGRIQNLRVISGHPLLVRPAMEAVSQWRYQPTLLNGEPVEVQTEINVNFILGN